ncbi:hypothetical protein CHS0354_010642 [Potamilus streckersoni]|uniref:Ubiquitin-protein ligase E3C n=1 Tax=Potamilus streckersoni TaxID=2493646 RepID=A0AAE0TD04_9BIVA|nr:hypothetical protein CHS0354_010642 [Potamilus streckersoni]
MYSFEGHFRRKPIQSLRGASRKEERDSLLQRVQAERQKREDQRVRNESAVKIQKFYRGYRERKRQNNLLRHNFDACVQAMQRESQMDVTKLYSLSVKLCHFYSDSEDGTRMVWLCQQLIKQKTQYVQELNKLPYKGLQQRKHLLYLCLRYLSSIAQSSQPMAIPMRILELFTMTGSYQDVSILKSIWWHLVENGYFICMRHLLNAKVPSSLERSNTPPTPVAASIYDLIMSPISFAASTNDRKFSNFILANVSIALLCPAYSEQISQFLLPAMAYGKYPFPFVDLIHTLIDQTSSFQANTSPTQGKRKKDSDGAERLEVTPWLLGAFLTLADKHQESLTGVDFVNYLKIIERLFPMLPALSRDDDDEDSDSEEEMETDFKDYDINKLQEVGENCLQILDSQVFIQKVISHISQKMEVSVINSVSVICHQLLSKHRFSVHKRRLLYSLAFNSQFVRCLWVACVAVSTTSATGTKTTLLQMLCRGLPLSEGDINRVVPILSTFCSMFSHSLHTLHDADFFGDYNDKEKKDKGSSMPFTLMELVPMTLVLRDVCLGIIELAHPDAKPTINEDYRIALKKTGVKERARDNQKDALSKAQWGYLFKVTAGLVRQLYTRDARRHFCPFHHWLSDRVKIQAEGPSQIYRANHSVFTRRPFRTMQSLTKTQYEDEGPPLSNKDVKNLVILTELPFVVSFEERVKIFQKLIQKDREDQQGNLVHFMSGPSIGVTIRRNYIYEDAFDKLSPENEPNLKLKMRVQLVNAAGLDEVGVDGGGIFREFLSQLLKTGFDPNRGFFSQTTDHFLYPNPQSSILVENFTEHFYFLGRMLGKALYENMLIELPFASFFLSKILSRHSGDLDIHHLASLDPQMYKNLLFLKHYDGSVEDLGLDFSTVESQFGETKMEELKPGGRNIPVTSSNRIEYIHLMADYKINKQIRPHCIAFRRGLSDLINLEWLRMFDHHELQVLISGAPVPIDLDDMKRHTHYSGGYTDDHPVIQVFWKVVEQFTEDQKRKLLKFVTSCSRPPLLGFKDLYPALAIHYGGSESDRLPTASTCMNLLKLPEIIDERTMRQKLLYAVESEAGFELS